MIRFSKYWIQKIGLAILIIFTNSLCGFSQNNDTIFLKRELTEKSYNVVYVVTDSNFERYDWLIPSPIKGDYLSLYTEVYNDILADSGIDTPMHANLDLPLKWSSLFMYKDKFYVYSPSDWYTYFGFEITDSTLIRHTGEGPYPEILLSYKKVTDFKYLISTKAFFPKEKYNIEISIIDKNRGIAIWEIKSSGETYYKLMVDSDKVKEFPMAVCKCTIGKCLCEFKFDEPDYKKMINNEQ